MSIDRLGVIETWLSIAVIGLAVPQVLWPGIGAGLLRTALIGVFAVAVACGLLKDHRSGLLHVPVSELPKRVGRGRNSTLHLCATVMALWVIFFPPA